MPYTETFIWKLQIKIFHLKKYTSYLKIDGEYKKNIFNIIISIIYILITIKFLQVNCISWINIFLTS